MRRQRILGRQLASLAGFHEQLQQKQEELEAHSFATKAVFEDTDNSISRLEGLRTELERRYESLVNARHEEVSHGRSRSAPGTMCVCLT